ncbi:hypothetical protein EVG20_g9300 [Dentipellis fragilis]|uniref:Uncharacterized protein n=1 Tax=Dentipellis fragilis TaxID=205917 RepID=A0A4Y9Y189_9AGAM|nr:hypothetical protein EVG20_g9300 [Dentipellis fragilis]
MFLQPVYHDLVLAPNEWHNYLGRFPAARSDVAEPIHLSHRRVAPPVRERMKMPPDKNDPQEVQPRHTQRERPARVPMDSASCTGRVVSFASCMLFRAPAAAESVSFGA